MWGMGELQFWHFFFQCMRFPFGLTTPIFKLHVSAFLKTASLPIVPARTTGFFPDDSHVQKQTEAQGKNDKHLLSWLVKFIPHLVFPKDICDIKFPFSSGRKSQFSLAFYAPFHIADYHWLCTEANMSRSKSRALRGTELSLCR